MQFLTHFILSFHMIFLVHFYISNNHLYTFVPLCNIFYTFHPLITYNAQALAVASEQCVTITETSLKNITLVNFLIILILIIVVAANINEGKWWWWWWTWWWSWSWRWWWWMKNISLVTFFIIFIIIAVANNIYEVKYHDDDDDCWCESIKKLK